MERGNILSRSALKTRPRHNLGILHRLVVAGRKRPFLCPEHAANKPEIRRPPLPVAMIRLTYGVVVLLVYKYIGIPKGGEE